MRAFLAARWLRAMACLLAIHAQCVFAVDSPAVAGWIERVRITPGEIVVQAKLDTGADTSSLHAKEIRWFRRDGKDWVGFDVEGENGAASSLESPVLRIARIRSAVGGVQRRPTVLLGLCLGTVYQLAQVNLVDRSSMNERMLIGRRFLAGHFTVDSGRQHLHEPSCSEPARP